VWEAAGLGIPKREASSSNIVRVQLGFPLHSDNINTTLTKRVRVLDRIVERVSSLSNHEVLYLFLNFLAISKLMFLDGCVACFLMNV